MYPRLYEILSTKVVSTKVVSTSTECRPRARAHSHAHDESITFRGCALKNTHARLRTEGETELLPSYAHAVKTARFGPAPADYDLFNVARYRQYLGEASEQYVGSTLHGFRACACLDSDSSSFGADVGDNMRLFRKVYPELKPPAPA